MVNITWKAPETVVEINDTHEVTGKFGGNELTGFDEESTKGINVLHKFTHTCDES